MKIGMELGLGPGHIALDGDPAPPPKGTHPLHNFRPTYVVVKRLHGWIKMPLGTEVGLGPCHIVLDGNPASPQKGTAPNFRPMSIVAKRSPISATAEHLYNYTFDIIRRISVCRRRDASGIVGGVAVLHPAQIPQPAPDLYNAHRASAGVVVQ